MIGGWVWRIVIYSLIWQSVTWRPGKVRFLIAMKNRSISSPPRSPTPASFRRRDAARFAISVGLRPPCVANAAMLSHPDCRAFLTLIAAHHLGDPHSRYHAS